MIFEFNQNISKLDTLRIRENDLQFDILKWDDDAIEYDVSHCIYADFFRDQGEPELGGVLVCDCDVYLVEEVTGPEVEY